MFRISLGFDGRAWVRWVWHGLGMGVQVGLGLIWSWFGVPPSWALCWFRARLRVEFGLGLGKQRPKPKHQTKHRTTNDPPLFAPTRVILPYKCPSLCTSTHIKHVPRLERWPWAASTDWASSASPLPRMPAQANQQPTWNAQLKRGPQMWAIVGLSGLRKLNTTLAHSVQRSALFPEIPKFAGISRKGSPSMT